MVDPLENAARTIGFEFIEYATPDRDAFGAHLARIGFIPIAEHRSKNVALYRQGAINVVVNADTRSFEQSYTHLRGVRICAVALRVRNAAAAYDHALRAGAWAIESPVGVMEVNIPAVAGAGDTSIYFVDRFEHPSIYDIDFVPLAEGVPTALTERPAVGLTRIHSITYRVGSGRARECASFSATALALLEIRDANMDAVDTGVVTVQSPDGAVRLVFDERGRSSERGAAEAAPERPDFARHATFETPNLAATLAALGARGIRPADSRAGTRADIDAAAGNDRHSRRRMFAPAPGEAFLFEVIERPTKA